MSQKEELTTRLKEDYGIDANFLLKEARRYMPGFNEQKLVKAFEFSMKAHDGQKRADGSPYIIHPYEATKILISLHADLDTLIAGLLHDVPEDTAHTLEEIEEKFGKSVAYLVDGITKLSKVHYKHDMAKRQIESLKKLFIHSTEDPRVILIKLADRLHNMRTLHFIEKESKRIRIARETFEIFVPIANILGIEELKKELEELCFKYLFPEEYASLADRMQRNRDRNQLVIEKTIQLVEDIFKKNGIVATVYTRQRNLYSIYKKVVCEEKRLDDFDNTISFRILVQEKDDCYKALGLLHEIFKPKPGKFKDFIAVPKINGYKSLHTTVFGLNGINTEFFVRTNSMHLEAEFGIAAHYFNDEKNHLNGIEEDKRAFWAARILRLHKENEEDSAFMEDLKEDIFKDRIFVFTPKGDAIDLPQGATCIDFAYTIHTEVGNCALKADVNGKLIPMATELHNGDTVNIITSDLPKGPNIQWLQFAKTNVAKNRIKEYFKKVSYEEKIKTGRELLQREFDRAGLGEINKIPSRALNGFIKAYPKMKNMDYILTAIGEGDLNSLEFIKELYPRKRVSKFAKAAELEQLIDKNEEMRPVSVRIIARDEVGLMEKIGKTVAEQGLNIIKANGRLSYFSGDFSCNLVVNANSYAQVSRLFEGLEQIEGVKRVERLFWQRKLLFIIGSSLTFAFWAAHPLLLQLLDQKVQNLYPIVAELAHYAGIFLLFMMVYSLRSLTKRSFPELRETNAFWILTYSAASFALLTLLAEIWLFKLNFPWVLVFGLILMVFAYLTAEFINYRDRI